MLLCTCCLPAAACLLLPARCCLPPAACCMMIHNSCLLGCLVLSVTCHVLLPACCRLPGICRKIHNPRILLLDCPLEYKKGENQTNVELMKEEDW